MSFFDGLVTPDPPEPEPPQRQERHLARYVPPKGNELAPPQNQFVPALLEHIVEVGRGTDARVVLRGWEVWRHSVTMRLGVFLSRITMGGSPRHPASGGAVASGLRFGLLLGDGRRVTTLDDDARTSTPGGGPPRPILSAQPGMGGGYHYDIALHLSQLPPEGGLRLVVEWPDEGIPETATELDAAAVRAAAERAHEVWPDLDPDLDPSLGRGLAPTPPPGRSPVPNPASPSILKPPPMPSAMRPPGPVPMPMPGPTPMPAPRPASWHGSVPADVRAAYVSAAGQAAAAPSPPNTPPPMDRGDWEEMGRNGMRDVALVRARLTHGADPLVSHGDDGTLLHVMAEAGSVDVLEELARWVGDVDVVAEWTHETPLWRAVCHGRADNVAVLLAAGADPWRPVILGRSAGALARWTKMARLFEELPGYVPPTDTERAEQAEADRQADVFYEEEYYSISVAFVAGLDEDEVIRRLGGDPARCPVLDLDTNPGPFGTGPGGFDPNDRENAERFLGIRVVPGGCVVVQPQSYRASSPAVVTQLSPGTRAYGLHISGVKGTYGHLAVDGVSVRGEEIGRTAHGDSSDGHWLYRFWDADPEGVVGRDKLEAYQLAYAAAEAGVTITNASQVAGPPNRWLELSPTSPLLA
ncbi:ankyrin repeat domain-containing protein [Streptomycetaceae bacterium NBC_01309]